MSDVKKPLPVKRLRSECGRYFAELIPDGLGCHYRMFDAAGVFIGESRHWSNRMTAGRTRFEIGFGGVRAVFGYPRFPRWFRRRWVECWDIDCEGLSRLVEKCGGEVLVCFKAGMNCWNQVGFRGTGEVAARVDKELRRRKLGFSSRQKPGMWGIDCPAEARGWVA